MIRPSPSPPPLAVPLPAPSRRAMKWGEQNLSLRFTLLLSGTLVRSTQRRCPGWNGLKPEEEHPRQAHEERKEGVDRAPDHHRRSPPHFPRHQGGRGSGASKISLCASHCNSRGSWRAPPRSLVPGGERKEGVDRAPDHHRRSPPHFPCHQGGRGSGASKISLRFALQLSGALVRSLRSVAPGGTGLSPKKSTLAKHTKSAKKAWTVPLFTTSARRPTSRTIKAGEEVGQAKSLSALRTSSLGGAGALHPEALSRVGWTKARRRASRQAHEERKEGVDRAADHHRCSPPHFPRHQGGRGSGASKISLCASHCNSRGRWRAPPRGVAPDGTDLSPKKSLSPRWRHNTIGDVSPEAYEVTLKIHLRGI